MGDIDEILDQLATEPAFRAELARDPKTALRGHELSTDDLRRLADALAEGDGDGRSGAHHASLRELLTGHEDADA